jgi:thiol-disulfide isomerase/thioredoxin
METVSQVSDFKARIQGPCVVMFTAGWCGPCKRIKPDFNRLGSMHTGIDFFMVDVDQGPEIASMENIQSMPTFKFYMNGKIVKQFTGANIALLEENMSYFLSVLKITEN